MLQRNLDEKYRHKNKTECSFSKPVNTPFISDTTISLLQLSHRIKSLEDKLLKSTSQKTIVRRFQKLILNSLTREAGRNFTFHLSEESQNSSGRHTCG